MKVEIERDAIPGSSFPYRVRVGGGAIYPNDAAADALEAALMPDQSELPEGFRRWPDGTILARGDAWNRERGTGEWERLTFGSWTDHWCDSHLYVKVRRTQKTELVPWHEANCRRLLSNRLILEVAKDGLGPKVRVGSEWLRTGDDGMVEVLK